MTTFKHPKSCMVCGGPTEFGEDVCCDECVQVYEKIKKEIDSIKRLQHLVGNKILDP